MNAENPSGVARTVVDLLDVTAEVPSAAWVSAGLLGGFLTARVSGVRALGGVVLAGCGALAGRQWLRRQGPAMAGMLGGGYLMAFGLSHPLAKKIGAWPSVFTVTAAAAAAAALSDAELLPER